MGDQLEQSDDDSSEDDGIGHISPPHGRSSSLRINIQQNIYNSNFAQSQSHETKKKKKKKKNRRKKKRGSQRLKLIQQLSDPIRMPSSNSQSDNDLEYDNGDDDVLCTIEPPG